jgi:hypothetical protein
MEKVPSVSWIIRLISRKCPLKIVRNVLQNILNHIYLTWGANNTGGYRKEEKLQMGSWKAELYDRKWKPSLSIIQDRTYSRAFKNAPLWLLGTKCESRNCIREPGSQELSNMFFALQWASSMSLRMKLCYAPFSPMTHMYLLSSSRRPGRDIIQRRKRATTASSAECSDQYSHICQQFYLSPGCYFLSWPIGWGRLWRFCQGFLYPVDLREYLLYVLGDGLQEPVSHQSHRPAIRYWRFRMSFLPNIFNELQYFFH